MTWFQVAMETENGTANRKGNLHSMWPSGDVSGLLSDRKGKEGVPLQPMSRGGAREQSAGTQRRPKKAPARIGRKYGRAKHYKCDICGRTFTYYQDKDKRTRCDECRDAMHEVRLPCALCGNVILLRRMVKVRMQIGMGKKGGKQYDIYYCQQCDVTVRARARNLASRQESVLKGEKKKIRRMVKR